MMRFKLSILLLLGLMSSITQATLIDSPDGQIPTNADVVARVRVLQSQTVLDKNSTATRMITFHDAEVIECLSCQHERNGDPIALATLGGRVGALGQHVAGAPSLSEGEEAWVYLSRQSPTWGARVVIHAQEDIEGPSGQTSAFLCTRVPTSGPSVYWSNRHVVMRPGKSNDPNISESDLKDSMQWAAEQWSNTPCSDFRFSIGEPATQDWIGYDWLAPEKNENIVTLRKKTEGDIYSEWVHISEALGVTSVTYVYSTGEILDADIEFNGDNFTFSNCELNACKGKRDLKSTATHEFGHVAGLGHPPITFKNTPETTMYAASSLGETKKRTLLQDDIDGLCFIYPRGAETKECYNVTRRPPAAIIVAPRAASGCQQHSTSSNSLFMMFLLAIIMVKSGVKYLSCNKTK